MFIFFFLNDTATTEIYPLPLHDALPIYFSCRKRIALFRRNHERRRSATPARLDGAGAHVVEVRSEEHTSELQSQSNLVCRLLLEKKKKNISRRLTATHVKVAIHASRRDH